MEVQVLKDVNNRKVKKIKKLEIIKGDIPGGYNDVSIRSG